jgi:hypothetical protein
VEVEVTDWPARELDRFKAKRPHIYAQMTTRLMTVTPAGPREPGAEDCAKLQGTAGSGQGAAAASCLSAAGGPARKAGAVAKSSGSL